MQTRTTLFLVRRRSHFSSLFRLRFTPLSAPRPRGTTYPSPLTSSKPRQLQHCHYPLKLSNTQKMTSSPQGRPRQHVQHARHQPLPASSSEPKTPTTPVSPQIYTFSTVHTVTSTAHQHSPTKQYNKVSCPPGDATLDAVGWLPDPCPKFCGGPLEHSEVCKPSAARPPAGVHNTTYLSNIADDSPPQTRT